jgi:hypothetical protein
MAKILSCVAAVLLLAAASATPARAQRDAPYPGYGTWVGIGGYPGWGAGPLWYGGYWGGPPATYYSAPYPCHAVWVKQRVRGQILWRRVPTC